MKVRIGGIEIIDVSLEELDELIARYSTRIEQPAGDAPPASSTAAKGNNPTAGSASDMVLLRKFLSADPSGVKTADVGAMLGKGGKAIRPAAKAWAKRVGLTSDENTDPFEDCRVGESRGMRIKDALSDLAKHLANS